MADTPLPFDLLCLDALKAIGKTLGQMNLYRVGHPAVVAAIQESSRLIAEALRQAPNGEIAYALDQNKLIADGRVIGSASQVPNSILGLFNRYRLNSITFKTGLTDAELTALCELVSLRPDQAKGVDAAAFLKERNVLYIGLNEAIYAKVKKAAEGLPPVETGAVSLPTESSSASARSSAASSGKKLAEEISQYPLEQSIDALVKAAVEDPADQAQVYRTVLEQIQKDLEQKVTQATQAIRREKIRVENEHGRTQAVLTNMAEGVVVVDDQGKVLMMNSAAEDLYGVRLVDVAGKPLVDQVKEEHLLALAGNIAKPGDEPVKPEVAVTSSESALYTLRASTAVVQNEEGKPVGMVSVLSDVTKHKELEHREREFVAHVTHELRAPLSSIRASLELLEGQFAAKLEGDDVKIFQTALKNADRLDGLIKGILDFAKIEAGQMTVHPQPIDAEKIAGEGAESLRPWCLKKGIQLAVQADPGLPQVSADFPRTVQVLVNLLSNAIKFTPAQGRITVRAKLGTGLHDRFVLFSVQDTGSGIPKSEHKRIFEKFVQIASGERHVGGTGLGLAIAKALIHLQKGQMWVESEVGQGATFFFTLPIYAASKETADILPSRAKTKPWWKKLLGLK